MRSSKPTPKPQSEAPSVDAIIDRLILEYSDHIEADDDLSDWHIEKPIIFQRKLVEAKAKINRLIVQGRLERGIYELERLEHDPQMFGDWEKVVEERIHLLETELSALSNNLSKEDGK